jgi:predicted TPR repeat methyltransferase
VTPEASALLQQALQLHQQGKLDAAQDLYRQVLARVPRQFDALHLLGVIARQRGDAQQSAALIREALQIDPGQARAHCNLGAALQDLGEPQAALQSYETALGLDPHYALAWDNRGNTLRRLGSVPEALDSYDRALALRPDYLDAWCHRAIVLHDLGRFDEAAASAEQALQLRPAWPEALLALGNALQGLERFGEAVTVYDQALAWSQRADVWCARGAALKKSGALADALDSYEHALALRPDYALAQHYRANVLRALNRKEEALAAYRQALDLGADAAEIGFALAALGEGELPAAAPSAYVKGLFDQYAGHFDQHLVDVLAYRTPALLEALLRPHLAAPAVAALDLGCGTGLCAPLLRPLARHLTGVDLSQRMLDKASVLGVYDELACAEINAYLEAAPERWDLALAADVFVYFGDLAPVFDQVRRVLRAGGLFAFSVEALDTGKPWAITPSNRFAHALDYVEQVAVAAGFTVVETKGAALRREHGKDVAGHLVLLRAGGDHSI